MAFKPSRQPGQLLVCQWKQGRNVIQVSGFLLIYCPFPSRLVFGGNRETDIVVEFMMAGYINARGKKRINKIMTQVLSRDENTNQSPFRKLVREKNVMAVEQVPVTHSEEWRQICAALKRHYYSTLYIPFSPPPSFLLHLRGERSLRE